MNCVPYLCPGYSTISYERTKEMGRLRAPHLFDLSVEGLRLLGDQTGNADLLTLTIHAFPRVRVGEVVRGRGVGRAALRGRGTDELVADRVDDHLPAVDQGLSAAAVSREGLAVKLSCVGREVQTHAEGTGREQPRLGDVGGRVVGQAVVGHDLTTQVGRDGDLAASVRDVGDQVQLLELLISI